MEFNLVLLGFILSAIASILIFFARNIVKKRMNYGEENDAVLGMKIIGYVVFIIGLVLIFLNISKL